MTSTGNYTNIKSALAEEIMNISFRVVSKYIARSVIPFREKEDVTMAVVEKFLQKSDKILEAFEGKSSRSTYFTAVINRMCCEVIRKESKHWHSISNEENELNFSKTHVSAVETEKRMVVKNELKRLEHVLLLFDEESAKTRLFLKFFFDIPVYHSDIEPYGHEFTDEIKHAFSNRGQLNKGDVFENLAQIVNLVEGKSVKGDAIRMWLNKQIDTILNRLNGHGNSFHNRESLAILIELKYSENLSITKSGLLGALLLISLAI